jgi:ABC-type microcin C transport system permease subunit YejE
VGPRAARLAAGLVLTFGWAVGGLALLMVQYCSGGKWGLLLRRPLEAMSRTLPLVFVYWLVIVIFMKKLYLWAQVDGSNPDVPRR